MMEIKVQCDCGQRFKFDVEPVNGRMSFKVSCPICGVDGTPKANEILSQLIPAAPAEAAAAPTPAAAPPGLRIRIAEQPAPEAQAEDAAEAAMEAAPAAAPRRFPLPEAAAAKSAGKQPSFGLGLLGALIGVLVGSLIYFILFRYTNFRFKLIAIGVGYLSGLGAELLGRKEGSKELGMIAAALALAGIFSAQYFIAIHKWNEISALISGKISYEERMTEAKTAVKMIPNGSDEEIRVYLAKKDMEPGDAVDTNSISAGEMKVFREKTFPEDQDLVSGKLTKEAYEASLQPKKEKEKQEQREEEGTFKTIFMVLTMSRMNLIAMAAAAGLAYKVCANA